MSKNIITLKKGEFNNHESQVRVLIKWEGNMEYLRRVAQEAFISEDRTGDFQYHLYDIGGELWADTDCCSCKFPKVLRRVQFRLQNNRWIRKRKVRIHRESKSRFFGTTTVYFYKDCK